MEDGLFEMPGKGFNFQDVTLLFERAGVGMFLTVKMAAQSNNSFEEMESDEIIMMDDFTLQDAMTALEVLIKSCFFPAITLHLSLLRSANLA